MYRSGAYEACGGTCAPLRAEDEACEIFGNPECEEGLYCDGVTCKPRPTLGDPCTLGTECLSGRCFGDDSGGKTCQRLEDVKFAQLGETCDSLAYPCDQGLSCEGFDKTCVPPVDAGATCTPASPTTCPLGEWCDIPEGAASGTCRLRPRVGTTCATSTECNEGSGGMYCNDGKCALLRRIGESCSLPADRTSGRCDDGICVDPCLGID